jgi:thiol-disulfide isomerase/thioredoxin
MRLSGITAALGMLASVWTGSVISAELKPADSAPPSAFQLQDLNGRPHRLSDYRGKVVLVNFWATWCEPCRAEMPSIERLQKRLGEQSFAVLAINMDEPEARIGKFVSSMPLALPVLLDPGAKVTRAWKVRVLPASFVIGPDGRVRYTVIGDMDWSAPTVVDRMAKLLPGR